MMITLKPNADKTIKSLAYNDGVRAFYYSVCERYTKGYIQPFINDMQTLITKLGIMISTVSTESRNISYCYTSIQYLCKTVLDRPYLVETFDELGINAKGNDGKHKIKTNKIDMDRCVSTYNNLVNLIANAYNLPSLKKTMVVRKNSATQDKPATPTSTIKPTPNPDPQDAQIHAAKSQTVPTNKKKNPPSEVAATSDERIKLKAELVKGDGRYQKGFIRKVSMVNFVINVQITNPDKLKICSVTAYFKCGKKIIEKKLSTNNQSTTEIDLETTQSSENIEASVEAVYKIGIMKTKKIKTTVSKNF